MTAERQLKNEDGLVSRRSALKLAGLMLGGVTVTACAGKPPQIKPQPSESASAAPNLDAKRIESILSSVSQVVEKADKAQDANLLKERLVDPALAMRSAQYGLVDATGEKPAGFKFSPKTATVTNAQDWPRAIVAASVTDNKSLPVMAIFKQKDARSNYMLESWARLFPGRTVQTISAAEGSALVDPKSDAFMLPVEKAVQAWVDRLNGKETKGVKLAEDDFSKYYLEEKKKLEEAVESAGTVAFNAAPMPETITAIQMSTQDALTAASLQYTVTYERTDEEAELAIGGTAAKLLDDPQVGDDRVVVTYLVSVLLQVPHKKNEGEITALGAERVLQKVERKEK